MLHTQELHIQIPNFSRPGTANVTVNVPQITSKGEIFQILKNAVINHWREQEHITLNNETLASNFENTLIKFNLNGLPTTTWFFDQKSLNDPVQLPENQEDLKNITLQLPQLSRNNPHRPINIKAFIAAIVGILFLRDLSNVFFYFALLALRSSQTLRSAQPTSFTAIQPPELPTRPLLLQLEITLQQHSSIILQSHNDLANSSNCATLPPHTHCSFCRKPIFFNNQTSATASQATATEYYRTGLEALSVFKYLDTTSCLPTIGWSIDYLEQKLISYNQNRNISELLKLSCYVIAVAINSLSARIRNFDAAMVRDNVTIEGCLQRALQSNPRSDDFTRLKNRFNQLSDCMFGNGNRPTLHPGF